MFKIKCDSENNPPEVIARNELRATISIVPYKWANDESYLAWHDPELKKKFNWFLNEYGELFKEEKV